VGDGPRDLVFVPGWISNVEVFWEEPTVARSSSSSPQLYSVEPD
jgi:hypothetical protein